MNWVFEHFKVVVAIIAVIAYFFKQAKGSTDESAGDPGGEAERSRKIREEIQRKIAERRAGGAATASRQERDRADGNATGDTPPVIRLPGRPTLRPVDSFGGPANPKLPTFHRTEPAVPTPEMESTTMAAVLERQEKLAEQMKELERARAIEQRRAAQLATREREASAEAVRVGSRGTGPGDRVGWMEDLRTPQGLRRAMVQREVLGPPVALR